MSTHIEFIGGLGLTPQQGRVIECLAGGDTAKEAARKLNIAPCTVKAHADASRMRTGARNVMHLISLCWQNRVLISTQACLLVLTLSAAVPGIPSIDDQQQPMRTSRSATRTGRSSRRFSKAEA
ncbi:LuxR C-terminal-related transcriptional regulator [uncultured Zhongshania sp.]|mgnify:CR=1 FL=1|uniref:LuxR C-terminal-related transcriptional regulator n=1 Tax=uncultured Zhongshania sp. TaxID=1642288 RepID=UPI0030D93387